MLKENAVERFVPLWDSGLYIAFEAFSTFKLLQKGAWSPLYFKKLLKITMIGKAVKMLLANDDMIKKTDTKDGSCLAQAFG